MFTITNITKQPILVDGVSIDPGQKLDVVSLTNDMTQPGIKIRSTTLEDRKADVAAIDEGIKAMDRIIK